MNLEIRQSNKDSSRNRYAKMQFQTLHKPNGQLTFETVVPNLSSTRHVAAAAFYHCLGNNIQSVKRYLDVTDFIFCHSPVLATKDLIHLEQRNPYEPFTIVIV